MLILTATNITHTRAKKGKCGKPIVARPDGTADYDIWVGINQHCIWKGEIKGHVRDAGAEVLLRLIADKMAATRPQTILDRCRLRLHFLLAAQNQGKPKKRKK